MPERFGDAWKRWTHDQKFLVVGFPTFVLAIIAIATWRTFP